MPAQNPIFEVTVTERLPLPIAYIKPMPIPSTAWNEAPLRCIQINAQWASYLLGLVDLLDAPDAWQGSKVEVDAARDQVREIALAIAGAYECETSEMGIQDIRLDATCNVIEVLIDGVWTPKIGKDLLYPPLYFTGVPNVEDGVIYWDYVTNENCVGGSGQIQIDMPLGAQGPPGEPGETGASGADGNCDCGDTSPPPTLSSAENACGIATYLVTWHDGIFQDFIDQVDSANNVTELVADFLVLIPGIGTIAAPFVEAAADAITATTAALRADVTSTVLEEWQCELYCVLAPLGEFSLTAFQAWVTAMKASYTALGQQVWLDTILGYANSEINRRAVIGAATPSATCASLCDCDEDDGCTFYDFAAGAAIWEAAVASTFFGTDSFKLTTGQSQDNVQIRAIIPAGNLISVRVHARNTGTNNRLFVGKNSIGSTVRDSGQKTVYEYIPTAPIAFNGTSERLFIGLDWASGLNATHPQEITGVELCYG